MPITNQAAGALLHAAAARGIHFERGLNPMFVPNLQVERMAMDSGTPTWNMASNGVPPQYLLAYANQVIEQLVEKRAYMEIGAEYQLGDFATEQIQVPVQGYIGYTAPYGDLSTDGRSSVNNTFPMRDFYLGQTVGEYGEREEAQLAKAKINIVAATQESSANTLAIAQNKAFFYGNVNSQGVFLQQNYGILDNPASNGYTPVVAGATSGKVPWSQKTPPEINTDVVAAYAILQTQMGNNLSNRDRLLLCLSGVASAYLYATTNEYGISAYDTLKKNFPNLEVVEAPEYAANQGGSFQLIAIDKIRGGVVRDLFSYKFMAHRIAPQVSSFYQKFSFGTGGCLIVLPAAVASMSSIGS